MTQLLKQSQTASPLCFLMVDSADHIAGKTGLSPTVTLSKNGGSFASPSGAVTEIGSGWYKVAGNAADTNTLGPLLLHATATGADPTDKEFEVVAFDPQVATNLGLSALPTANPGAAGGVFIAGTNAPVTIIGSGDALTITSSGGNGVGLKVSGNGTGAGAQINAGATGIGLDVNGGATSGVGLAIDTTSGNAVTLTSGGGNGHGVISTGHGTGNAMRLQGGDSAAGLYAVAGVSGDFGVEFIGANDVGFHPDGVYSEFGWRVTNASGAPAVNFIGVGTGAAMKLDAGATGIGLDINGGSTSGSGLTIDSSSGDAAKITSSGGNGYGLWVQGNGSGNGGFFLGGTSGIGLEAIGGGSTAPGARFAGGTNGHGISVEGNGSGNGLNVTGGSSGRGASFLGQGSGAGFYVEGGATGIGMDLNGGSTSGAGLTVDSSTGDAMIVTSPLGNGDAIVLSPHGTGLGINSPDVTKLTDGIILGTAVTGTLSTTVITSNLTGYADDSLIGRGIYFLSGACIGEAREITDYANASGTLTFAALSTAPSNGDAFKIV